MISSSLLRWLAVSCLCAAVLSCTLGHGLDLPGHSESDPNGGVSSSGGNGSAAGGASPTNGSGGSGGSASGGSNAWAGQGGSFDEDPSE